jgi:hypothetical protein
MAGAAQRADTDTTSAVARSGAIRHSGGRQIFLPPPWPLVAVAAGQCDLEAAYRERAARVAALGALQADYEVAAAAARASILRDRRALGGCSVSDRPKRSAALPGCRSWLERLCLVWLCNGGA